MLNTFLCITNFLFPQHPTIKILKNETKNSFLRFYHLRQNNFITLADYQEKIVKEALKANKFHNYKPAAILLASLLENWLKDQTAEKIIFIPIPLGEKRQKERGFNQVTRVLENIHSEKNFLILPLLKRKRETFPQTELHRTERLKNIKDAFLVDENESENKALKKVDEKKEEDCLWVVVDDVYTTGATLTEAHKVLKEYLPKNQKVLCLALAH